MIDKLEVGCLSGIFTDISFKVLQVRHRFIWGDIRPENWANVDAYGKQVLTLSTQAKTGPPGEP